MSVEKMNIVNAFDGNKAKVGDRVLSLKYGWGTVERIDSFCTTHSFKVVFGSRRDWYTVNGKLFVDDFVPDLYYGPPEIIGPEKPKRMVKEEVRLWLNIYPKSCCKITYSSRSRADSAASPDRIACVELTGSYEVEED